MDKLSSEKIQKYIEILQARGEPSSVVKSKLRSVATFLDWAYQKGIISQSVFEQTTKMIAEYTKEKNIHFETKKAQSPRQSFLKKMSEKMSLLRSKIKKDPSSSLSTSFNQFQQISTNFSIQHYIGFGIALIFMALIGAGIYNRFFQKNTQTFAYPTSLTRAGRLLSFQGRLTDSLGNPINAATNVTFNLYGVSSGGSSLYTAGACSITPDTDGVFNVLIGGSGYTPTPPTSTYNTVCGTEIPATIFSENANLYMGVTAGSDAEMTPRQQIANVGYAINAETLQGFPPGTSTSTIPYINQDGDMIVGASAPGIRSTYSSATFSLTSNAAVTIQSANSGDIVLDATGSGALRFQTGSSSTDRMYVTNGGNVGIGTTAPLSKLGVLGNLAVGATYGAFAAPTSGAIFEGNVGIGTTGPAYKLDVNGAVNTAIGQGFRINTNQALLQSNGQSYLRIASGYSGGAAFPTGGIVVGSTYTGTVPPTNGAIIEGNLGIGTTNPSQKLDVNGIINVLTGYKIGNAAATSGHYLRGDGTNFVDGTIQLSDLPAITAAGGWTDGGSNVFLTTSSDNVGIGTSSPSNKLTVSGNQDITGNLGIGTVTPLSKLGVLGNLAVGATYGAFAAPTSGAIIQGNVGIGTTSPGALLHLYSADADVNPKFQTAKVDGLIQIQLFNDARNWNIKLDGADSDKFKIRDVTAGLDRLVIDTSGNVGIGTTAPSQKLDVNGIINTATGFKIANGSATSGHYLRGDGTNYVDGTIQLSDLPSITAAGGWNDDGTLVRLTTSTDHVGIGTTSNYAKLSLAGDSDEVQLGIRANSTQTTPILRVDNSTGATNFFTVAGNGNVGIGTTGPGAKLEVVGNGKFSSASTATAVYAQFYDGTNTLGIGLDNSAGSTFGGLAKAGYFGQSQNNPLEFATNNNIRMVILGGGNVGIGTTSPVAKLDIYGAGNSADIRLSNTATSNAGIYAYSATPTHIFSLTRQEGLGVGSLSISAFGGLGLTGGATTGPATAPHLFVTSGGNVGIGTTSPSAKLDVHGTGTTTGFAFQTADSTGAPKFTILDNGNVGIGTTSPGAKLNVVGGDILLDTTKAIGASIGGYDVMFDTNGQTYLRSNGSVSVQLDTGNNDADTQSFVINKNATTGGTELFRVQENGNVGIGTASPLSKLGVLGNLAVGATYGAFAAPTSGAIIEGNVGIGTTVPSQKLDVNGNIQLGQQLRFGSSSVNDYFERNTSDGGIYLFDNNSEVFRTLQSNIAFAGNVGIGTTNPTTALDVNGQITVRSLAAASATTLCINGNVLSSCNGSSSLTGTGIANYVARWTSATNLSTGVLYDDSTNVGIGITAPLSKLGVLGNLAVGATYGAFSAPTSGLIVEGNVGIGTTAPVTKLDVAGGDITMSNTSGENLFGSLGTSLRLDYASGQANSFFRITRGGTEMVRINSSGNVGIGTVTPLSKLGVLGNTAIGATYGAFSAPTSGAIIEGNVGIGTTNPTQKLDVFGNLAVTNSGTLTIGGITYTWPGSQSANALLLTNGSGTLSWSSPTGTGVQGYWSRSGTTLFPTTITDTIGTNGNVGIGTTDPDPQGRLVISRYDTTKENSVRLSTITQADWKIYQPVGTSDLRFFTDWGNYDYLTLKYDSGNVGIGTTNPGAKLEIAGQIKITGGSPGTNKVLTSDTNGLASWTSISGAGGIGGSGILNYVAKFTPDGNNIGNSSIFDNGNVGIGTTAPSALLSVGSTSQFQVTSTGVISSTGTGNALTLSGNLANIAFTGTGVDQITTAASQNLALMPGGNVGIGTTAPVTNLHIGGGGQTMTQVGYGGIYVNPNTNTAQMTVENNGGVEGGFFTHPSGTMYFGTWSNHPLLFNTNNTEYMRLTTSGNLGIGTTAPSQKLDVNGLINTATGFKIANGSAVSGHYLRGDGTNYVDGTIQLSDLPSITAAGGWNDGGSNVYLTTSSDNVGIGTSSPLSKLGILGNASIGTTYGNFNAPTSGLIVEGNVGIGTTNPTTSLDVNGQVTVRTLGGATATPLCINNGVLSSCSGSSSLTGSGIANYVARWTSGTNLSTGILYDDSTNVGIGTTAPSSLLSVGSTSQFQVNSTGNISTTATGNVLTLSGNLANIAFTGTGVSQITTAASQNLALMPGGNVGIGTTAPSNKLTVSGNADITGNLGIGTVTPLSKLGVLGNLAVGATYGAFSAPTSGLIVEGNVGIGTTNPNNKFQAARDDSTTTLSSVTAVAGFKNVNQTNNTAIVFAFQTNDANGNNVGAARFGGVFTSHTASAVSGDLFFDTTNAGSTTEKMRILSNGNIGMGTVSPLSKLGVLGNLAVGANYGAFAAPTSGAIIQGNVGIGTTNPAAKLQVVGNGTTTGFTLRTQDSSNVDRFVVQDNGNVGIGTTAPSQKLDVNGIVNVLTGYKIGNAAATSGHYLRGDGTNYVDGTIQTGDLPTITTAAGWTDGGTNVYLTTSSDNVGIGTSSPSNKLTVSGNADITGNLGIGTTNPQNTLDVNGNINVLNQIQFTAGDWNQIQTASNQTLQLNTLGTGDIVFQPGGVDKMRITNSGNVGIGTAAPLSKLGVLGNLAVGATYGAFAAPTSGLIVEGNVGIGTTGPSALLSVGATSQFQVDSTGNISTTATGNALTLSGNAANIAFTGTGVDQITTAGTSNLALMPGGNVGIGTTAPAYKLDVNGTIRGDYFLDSSNSNYGIDPAGTSNFGGYSLAITGGALLARDSGNVGIGTTNPSTFKLEVGGSIGPTADDTYDLGSNTKRWQDIYLGPGSLHLGTSTADEYKISFDTANNRLGFNANGSGNDDIVFDSSGNVGIGTTGPADKLNVAGSVTIGSQNDTNNAWMLNINGNSAKTSSNDNFLLQLESNEALASNPLSMALSVVGSSTATSRYGYIQMADAGTANYRNLVLNPSGGNVGIGTTRPSYNLQVGSTQYVGVGINSAAGGTQGQIEIQSSNTTAANGPEINFKASRTPSPSALCCGHELGTISFQGYGATHFIESAKILVADVNDNGWTDSENDAYMAFYTSDNATATEKMRIDKSGNVGIGATSPSSLLSVGITSQFQVTSTGAISTTATGNALTLSGNAANIAFTGTGINQITTAASQNLNLMPGGNVGIGTTGPSNKLTVSGNADITGNLGIGTVSPLSKLGVLGNLAVGATYGAFAAPTSGALIEGNVGIGGTNPGYRLTVTSASAEQNGTGTFAITTGSGSKTGSEELLFGVHDSDYSWIQAVNQGTAFRNLILEGSGGNLGIGNTNPGRKLSVLDSQATQGVATIRNANTGTTSTYGILDLKAGHTCDNGQRFIRFYDSATTDSNGTGVGAIVCSAGTDVTYTSGGADYAENFILSQPADLGDIISTLPEGKFKAKEKDTLLGVVSSNPIVLGNKDQNRDNLPNEKAIGLIGQIKTKVSNLDGPIKVGDAITSSSVSGIGTKAVHEGNIIGTALEPFDPTNGKGEILPCPEGTSSNVICGKILTYVHVSWYQPLIVKLSSIGDVQITPVDQQNFVYNGNLSDNSQFPISNFQSIFNDSMFKIQDSAGNIINNVGAFSEAVIGKLKTGVIQTENAVVNNILAAKNVIAERLIVQEKIVSPVVETKDIIATGSARLNEVTAASAQIAQIQTNEIKPQEKDLTINLENNSTSEVDKGALAKLIIKGLEGKTAAVIDSEGNATFSGTLAARDASISGTLAASEASISGTLIAGNVESENINSLTRELVNSQTDIASQSSSINDIQKLLADIRNNPLPNISNQTNLSNTTNLDQQFNNVSMEQLSVSGQSNLYNVAVSGSLLIGSTLYENNSIVSLASELKLSALSQITLFDGTVTIAKDGTITTRGALIAQGGVRTNTIQPISENDNVSVLLNSNQIRNSKLEIKNSEGNEVASVDASGSAYFKQLALDKYLDATNSGAVIAASDNFNKNGLFAPAIETQMQPAGVAILPANSSEIVIYNESVKNNSLIYLTPTTPNAPQLVVSQKVTNGKAYFKVTTDSLNHSDIQFNWLIIN